MTAAHMNLANRLALRNREKWQTSRLMPGQWRVGQLLYLNEPVRVLRVDADRGALVRYIDDQVEAWLPVYRDDLGVGAYRGRCIPPAWGRTCLQIVERSERRLQDFSDLSIMAEGCRWRGHGGYGWPGDEALQGSRRVAWKAMWSSLHPETEHRWEANPMVAIYTFTILADKTQHHHRRNDRNDHSHD